MPSLAVRIVFVALLIGIGGVVWLAQRSADELHRFRTDDPAVWEPMIAEFERAAAEAPPAPGSVLFLGASAIRFWDSLADDMAPLPAVGRGFGGAKVADVHHFADRLLLPDTGAIVLSIGGNDLFQMAGSNAGTVDEVAAKTRALLTRLAELAPGVPIYTLAIRPPIRDPAGRDPASQVNAQLEAFAAETDGVIYLDPNDPLYQESGEWAPEYRAWNRSQLSREGYRVWSAPIRERLLRDLS